MHCFTINEPSPIHLDPKSGPNKTHGWRVHTWSKKGFPETLVLNWAVSTLYLTFVNCHWHDSWPSQNISVVPWARCEEIPGSGEGGPLDLVLVPFQSSWTLELTRLSVPHGYSAIKGSCNRTRYDQLNIYYWPAHVRVKTKKIYPEPELPNNM